MVEQLTLNSLPAALVDISAVSMLIAHSLNLRHLCHCVVTKHMLFVCMEQLWDYSFSADETWDQHFTCCIYISVQCRCHGDNLLI
jgi:hypothetical protein